MMAPRKTKANIVWKYFENEIAVGKAICKLCKIPLKNNKNFNLRVHLMKRHNIDINDRENSCYKSASSEIASVISERKQDIKIQINKKLLFRSYIGLVTDNSVPFHILDSSNFKNIIEPICMGLSEKSNKRYDLNSTNCKSVLKTVADNIRDYMKVEMKNTIMSLKIYSVAGLKPNIFGISAQFIKEDEIKSLILGLMDLEAACADVSSNLGAEILRTLNKYDIQLNQVISITCEDNAANMLETTKMISSYNVKEEQEVSEENENVTCMSNVNQLGQPATLSVAPIQICRCVAQIAQLVAFDAAQDAEIQTFLLNCRNLTKFIQQSANNFEDEFELNHLTIPQLDCSKKWESTYEMIETLLNAKQYLLKVESVINKSMEENFANADLLWEFMDCYVTLFRPLQITMTKFHDEQLHYGNFYALWLKCKIFTTKIVQENNNRTLIQTIGSKLLDSIEKRTTELLANESLNACLLLDPRFHHTLSPQRRQDAVNYLNHIWQKLKLLSHADDCKNLDNTLVVEQSETPLDEAEELLDSFLIEARKAAASDESANADVYSKIKYLHLSFMRSSTDVLQFWQDKKYYEPELYALSKICFAIPPTQITIEGAFPSLKLILTDNGNTLSHETLEHILMVKLYPKFLDEAINSLPLFEDDA